MQSSFTCVLFSYQSVIGGASTDLVGALKEAFGKPKEFVHVDLDAELTKLGLKKFVPLDLWPPSMAVYILCVNYIDLNSVLG